LKYNFWIGIGFKNIDPFIFGIYPKYKYETDCHDHNMQIKTTLNHYKVWNVWWPAGPSMKSKVSAIPLC